MSSICWIYRQRNLVSAGCTLCGNLVFARYTLCGNLVFAGYTLWESGVFNTLDILSEESGICWIYRQRNLVSAGYTVRAIWYLLDILWESGVFNKLDILSEEFGIC